MGLVVNRIQPAVNSAYHARAKTIGVSLKSVYNKLDNLETGISAAMVGTTAERLETVVTTMGGALPPLLPGYRIKILDGNHLAATDHRIKELRTIRAGALPGQALVVLDPSLMLVTDVVLCEDGHAQERSLLGQTLEIVRAKDVWIDDRNFCTTGFLFGIARREAFFVVRQHAATLHWEFTGKKRACVNPVSCESGVSSSFLPEKTNRNRITREKMNRHRITHEPPMPFKRLPAILAVARSSSRMTSSFVASLVCRLTFSTMC